MKKGFKKTKISMPATNEATTAFDSLKKKFARLAEVREKLASLKALYQEHDQLVTELLPLFVKRTDKQFVIEREITIGTDKHTLSPYFFDEKKVEMKAKVWKSTALESFRIE